MIADKACSSRSYPQLLRRGVVDGERRVILRISASRAPGSVMVRERPRRDGRDRPRHAVLSGLMCLIWGHGPC